MLTDIIKKCSGYELYTTTGALYETTFEFMREYRRTEDIVVVMWNRLQHLEQTLDVALRSATFTLTSRNFGAIVTLLGIKDYNTPALAFGTAFLLASLIGQHYTKNINNYIENETKEIEKTRNSLLR